MSVYKSKALKNFSGDQVTSLQQITSMNQLPHQQKDENELADRNTFYTEILQGYSSYLVDTMRSNISNKRLCIIGLLVILGMVTSLLIGIVVLTLFVDTKLDIVVLLTTFISFISAIIVIPVKIVEYLFNTEEMRQINDVIRNIQDYDKAVREDLLKRKNL